jgi:regulatory protein
VNELRQSAETKELRQRAVRLLARREHTRAELLRKLAPHGTPEEIEIVLTELAANGLQSDARFAESYIRSQAARLGSARLRQSLRTKGVSAELINSQLAGADLPDEMARAQALWTRKYSAPPTDAHEWAKQARFLQGRGFSAEVIRKLLKSIEE